MIGTREIFWLMDDGTEKKEQGKNIAHILERLRE